MSKSAFRSSRFFHQATGDVETSGWYYNAREGAVFGPFENRALAEAHLKGFIEYCLSHGENGGRGQSGGAEGAPSAHG